MSDEIAYKKNKDAVSAFQSVKKSITPATLARFQVEAKVDYDEQALKIKAQGKGFELKFDFKDHALALDIELSLLLRPLKGKILTMLKRELESVV